MKNRVTLKPIELNAIQIALQGGKDYYDYLKGQFQDDSYDYLNQCSIKQLEDIKECLGYDLDGLHDELKSMEENMVKGWKEEEYEDFRDKYEWTKSAKKKVEETIKNKGINKSSIEHTIQCLRDIINGDASVHNMGGLSDFLLENAFKIDDGNKNYLSRKTMIIESCLWLIDVLEDIIHREDYSLEKYNLDYRVVDWLIGCTKVQEELSNE